MEIDHQLSTIAKLGLEANLWLRGQGLAPRWHSGKASTELFPLLERLQSAGLVVLGVQEPAGAPGWKQRASAGLLGSPELSRGLLEFAESKGLLFVCRELGERSCERLLLTKHFGSSYDYGYHYSLGDELRADYGILEDFWCFDLADPLWERKDHLWSLLDLWLEHGRKAA